MKFTHEVESSNGENSFLDMKLHHSESPNNGCFHQTAIHNFQKRLLRYELKKTIGTLKQHLDDRNEKRNTLKDDVSQVLLPAIVYDCHPEALMERMVINDRHNNKLIQLSKQQHWPLFSIKDSVKVLDVNVQIPKFVFETLSLGPKNPVLRRFNSKAVLAEVDLLLKFCESKSLVPEVKNQIGAETVNYNSNCVNQAVQKNVTLTKKFLKEHQLINCWLSQ